MTYDHIMVGEIVAGILALIVLYTFFLKAKEGMDDKQE